MADLTEVTIPRSRDRSDPDSGSCHLHNSIVRLILPLFMVVAYGLLLSHSFRLARAFAWHADLQLEWITLLLFALWALAVSLGWLLMRRLPGVMRILCICIFLILAFLIPPFLSSDAYLYTTASRVVTEHGENPYEVSLRTLDSRDPFLGYSPWDKRVSLYGPVLLALQIPMGWVSSWVEPVIPYPDVRSLLLPIYAFKLISLLLHIANIGLVRQILVRRGAGAGEIDCAVWFYALNPIIILEGLVDAHNEMAIATLLLLSIRSLEAGRSFAAYCWALLSIFCKYTSVLLLPIYGLIALKARRYALVIAMLVAGAGAILLFVLHMRLHPEHMAFLQEMGLAAENTPLAYLRWEFGFFQGEVWVRGLQVLCVLLVLVVSWARIRRGDDPLVGVSSLVTALLISSYTLAYFNRWYLVPMAALSTLLPAGRLRNVAIIFQLSVLASEVHPILPWEYRNLNVGWQFAPPVLYLILSLLRTRRTAGARRTTASVRSAGQNR